MGFARSLAPTRQSRRLALAIRAETRPGKGRIARSPKAEGALGAVLSLQGAVRDAASRHLTGATEPEESHTSAVALTNQLVRQARFAERAVGGGLRAADYVGDGSSAEAATLRLRCHLAEHHKEVDADDAVGVAATVACGVGAEEREGLAAALRVVRAAERGEEGQRALAEAQAQAAEEAGLSADNFAYGTTALASWCELLGHDVVPAPPCVAVLGASSGLLALYTAALLGPSARVEGFELLGPLVQVAERARAAAGPLGSRVRLHCGDFRELWDPSRYGLVVLASRCWDERLREWTRNVLAARAPHRCLVVDYSAELAAARTEGQGRFHEVARTTARTSWSPAQELVLLRCSRPARDDGSG